MVVGRWVGALVGLVVVVGRWIDPNIAANTSRPRRRGWSSWRNTGRRPRGFKYICSFL